MPCPRHSDGYRVFRLEGLVHFGGGGFTMGPVGFHFLISVVLIELFSVHNKHSRACRGVLHLASMFARAQPPFTLGSCSLVTGTQNIAPCQMNQVHTVVIYCTCSLVGWIVPDIKLSREDIGVHMVFFVQ